MLFPVYASSSYGTWISRPRLLLRCFRWRQAPTLSTFWFTRCRSKVAKTTTMVETIALARFFTPLLTFHCHGNVLIFDRFFYSWPVRSNLDNGISREFATVRLDPLSVEAGSIVLFDDGDGDVGQTTRNWWFYRIRSYRNRRSYRVISFLKSPISALREVQIAVTAGTSDTESRYRQDDFLDCRWRRWS